MNWAKDFWFQLLKISNLAGLLCNSRKACWRILWLLIPRSKEHQSHERVFIRFNILQGEIRLIRLEISVDYFDFPLGSLQNYICQWFINSSAREKVQTNWNKNLFLIKACKIAYQIRCLIVHVALLSLLPPTGSVVVSK